MRKFTKVATGKVRCRECVRWEKCRGVRACPVPAAESYNFWAWACDAFWFGVVEVTQEVPAEGGGRVRFKKAEVERLMFHRWRVKRGEGVADAV